MHPATSVLNLGSLNIDRVFRVGRIVAPGETIDSASLQTFAGGKGANQSVALARAGARVAHAGRIGPDGGWLLEALTAEGIDVARIQVGRGPTGQATIQVDDRGQNAIVLFGGANREITPDDIDRALEGRERGSWLLLQNETSAVDYAIRRARVLGLRVAFNPAPLDDRVAGYPLQLVDLLCLNETEGAALSGAHSADGIMSALVARWPKCDLLLTLGAAGVCCAGPAGALRVAAPHVTAIDTTAAGDTFLGYYLANLDREPDLQARLELACRAAALCVTRPGALASIPHQNEVLGFC